MDTNELLCVANYMPFNSNVGKFSKKKIRQLLGILTMRLLYHPTYQTQTMHTVR